MNTPLLERRLLPALSAARLFSSTKTATVGRQLLGRQYPIFQSKNARSFSVTTSTASFPRPTHGAPLDAAVPEGGFVEEATTATYATSITELSTDATSTLAEGTTVETTELLTQSLSKLGDLAAMGLSKYTPPGIIEQILEAVHVYSGLPFWGTVVCTTLGLRLALFPLILSLRKNVIRFTKIQPEYEKAGNEMKLALKEGRKEDFFVVQKQTQDLLKENKCHPLKMLAMPFVQAPIMISFFIALRAISELPIHEVMTGGLAWFPNLCAADPYHVLPVLSAVSMMGLIKMGSETGQSSNALNQEVQKYIMMSIPLTIPFMWNFPSIMFVYMLTSNLFSVGQMGVFKSPTLSKMVGLPKMDEDAMKRINPLFGSHPSTSSKGLLEKIDDIRIEAQRREEELKKQQERN